MSLDANLFFNTLYSILISFIWIPLVVPEVLVGFIICIEIDSQDKRAKELIMKEILQQNKKDKKDLDMKGLEALVKMAIEQSKEETKNGRNEEG